VTPQVRALAVDELASFLVRDATENWTGAEQSFFGREKGEQPPQLVVTLAAG
jgi:hypothetical protein